VNTDLTIHENVLPDGLPNTDELCIVALGFQLNADGTMRDELIERLKVVLNSAEKYPNALIVCTGGGTAAENEASTEAGKMAEWLIANGIPEERIIIEDRSLTTAQNAIYTYDILTERYPQVSQLALCPATITSRQAHFFSRRKPFYALRRRAANPCKLSPMLHGKRPPAACPPCSRQAR
jgi:DUF218 domain.